eukprot:m.278548 g.278548  ORF g.278548 m.278548 type:complete len:65 (+) comp22879_c1_seq19:511-705(+)
MLPPSSFPSYRLDILESVVHLSVRRVIPLPSVLVENSSDCTAVVVALKPFDSKIPRVSLPSQAP